jgi:ribosomal protein S12 methylthiotransferase accessory factor
MLAIAETLERYASMHPDGRLTTRAPAARLGTRAMDLSQVARCSAREMRHPRCPLHVARPAESIRWVEAIDLIAGEETLVPAVMVYWNLACEPAERFWLPITTGCAIHTSIEAATVNAICEVIERDAIALTWLQRLPLPRLAGSCVPDEAREIIQWLTRWDARTYLFDATTDVGVPTVYCVLTTGSGDRAAQLVSGATDFDVRAAVLKAVLEVSGLRAVIHAARQRPRRYADHASVLDGATVMAHRARRRAFSFLLDDLEHRPVSEPGGPGSATAAGQLRLVLRRLDALGMSAFAVDLSTREIEEAGLAVSRVVIPQLQPMSLRPLAQYRGHPRLYRGPAGMGMPVRPESRLNPYPQPMS